MKQLIEPRQSSFPIYKSTEEREQEAETCFSLAVQSAHDGLCDWNMVTNEISFSRRWKELLGYEEKEIPNEQKEWTDRVHPGDLERILTALQQAFAGFTAQSPLEYRIRHKDESYRWMHAHGVALRDGNGNPYRLLIWQKDITRQRQAENREKQQGQVEDVLRKRINELSQLLEILRTLPQTDEPELFIGSILEKLKSTVPCTSIIFFRLEKKHLHLLKYWGPLPPEEVVSLNFSEEHFFLSEEVLRYGKARIIDDIQATSLLTATGSGSSTEVAFKHLLSSGRSVLGVPLVIQEQAIGLLLTIACEPNRYTPHHAEIAFALATQVALVIKQSRYLHQKQHRAIAEERQRLAYELHDSVTQELYSIGLGAHIVREEIENNPQQAIEPIEYVISLAELGLAEIRDLIFELQSDPLKQESLLPILHQHILVLRTHYKLIIHADLAEEPDVSYEAKHALFRITQEACFNTIKHAHATTITLRLTREGKKIILEIRDNGIGFDLKDTLPKQFGLLSMKKRVTKLGGTFLLESTVGQGTSIKVCIPVG